MGSGPGPAQLTATFLLTWTGQYRRHVVWVTKSIGCEPKSRRAVIGLTMAASCGSLGGALGPRIPGGLYGEEVRMQVTAFSTPKKPDWRWRIVNYAGETIQESRETFPTIAAAVARGTQYMSRLRADRSTS